jgi:acetyl esterase/lipase
MKIPVIPVIFIITFNLIIRNAMSQDLVIKVWPDKIPGSQQDPSYKGEHVPDKNNPYWIEGVTDPTISVYLPKKEKANGTAIIICPGGGYWGLATAHEGFQVAQWLNELGIAGIVLKYRIPNDAIMKNKNVGPLQDAQESIRIVRRKAKDWNINPDKIGIMGYSAGGHLASTASTHYNEKVYPIEDNTSAKPTFSVLIYPVISMKKGITHEGSKQNLLGQNPDSVLVNHFSNELQVDKDTPPAFLVHSADDEAVPVQNSINYFLALKKNNIPVELHMYEKGGHGYGFGGNQGTQNTWPELLKKWLTVHSWL